MTTPEADFGETLRRALAAVDHVEPAEDALDRIRKRTRLRTPRQGLGAVLAALTPWPLFRVFVYRTQVVDLLRAGRASARLRALAFAERCAALGGRVPALADSLTQQVYEHALAPVAKHVTPVVRRGVDRLDQITGRGYDHTRRGLERAAPVTRRLFGPAAARVSRAWKRVDTPRPPLPSPMLPRHADHGPPRGRLDWMKPTLTATSVAFVATLALTVPTVRQAIVQIGSTVLPSGQNPGGTNASTLTGGAKHVLPGGQQHGGGAPPGIYPGPPPPTGAAASPIRCPSPTQSPAGWPAPGESSCVSSTPYATTSPTSSPSPTVSPSASPTPLVTPSPTPSPSATPTADTSPNPPPVESTSTP